MMKSQIIENNKLINVIKHIVISFFVLIFIMGFFSKSFINIILPKVQTVPAINNTSIMKTIGIEGVIRPKVTYKARLDRAIVIEEYFVKTGEKVEVGIPLFRINQSYGGKGNREALEKLELQLQEQQIELERLRQSTEEIQEQSIKLLEDKIKNVQEEARDQEILYQAGAISRAEFEKSKLQFEEQILSLKSNIIQQEDDIRSHRYLINKTQSTIDEIKASKRDLKKQQEFYVHLGEDGHYYSEYEGIILAINDTNKVIDKDTTVVEIALVEGFESVKFVAQVDQDQYDILKEVGMIEVINKDMSKNKITVTHISKLAKGSKLELEGEFVDKPEKDMILDEAINGIIAKKYESGENYSIPKTAIIPTSHLKKGTNGRVFLIEEKQGVLGKEIIAKEVQVEIIAVGDDRIIVQGLEHYKDAKLINNLSYKIKDGVRVHLWE